MTDWANNHVHAPGELTPWVQTREWRRQVTGKVYLANLLLTSKLLSIATCHYTVSARDGDHENAEWLASVLGEGLSGMAEALMVEGVPREQIESALEYWQARHDEHAEAWNAAGDSRYAVRAVLLEMLETLVGLAEKAGPAPSPVPEPDQG